MTGAETATQAPRSSHGWALSGRLLLSLSSLEAWTSLIRMLTEEGAEEVRELQSRRNTGDWGASG